MAFKFVLLVLPALALTDIDVILSGNVSKLYVNYGGKDVGVVTNTERNAFGLNDNDLKKAIFSYFEQLEQKYDPKNVYDDEVRQPDKVYLSSPTPGDLYKTYRWREVTRTLKPQNGKILAISSLPTVVAQQLFENNSTEPATFDVGISRSVLNTFNSTWSTNGLLSIEHEIYHKIQIKGKNGQMTYFNYPSVWNQNTQWTQPVTVGSSSSIKFILQPGQAVVAHLMATRVSIQMQVEYEANLHGRTAVNFATAFRGNNFYGLNITDLMELGGISNMLISQEVIDIEFYSSSSVDVSNKDRFY